MKKISLSYLKIFIIILSFVMIPTKIVNAQDYTLKSGKSVKGSYNEEDYNYYKIKPSKSGYLAITSTTSNGSTLQIDICNGNKEVVASNIKIKNKATVLHKAKKGSTYYLRIKGVEGLTYSISYKVQTIGTLTYAKKYSYTFTNTSFHNENNAIYLKLKANNSGNLNFMCNCNNAVKVKYLNSSKKAISTSSILNSNTLTGIGIRANKTYYIKLWKSEDTTVGTTTISNLKYQINKITFSSNKTKSKAKTLSEGKYNETLIPAGTTTTTWYKIKLNKKKKLSITVESRMLQNNGKYLQLYICNKNGKKLHKTAITIDNTATSRYKNKKYIMTYPRKKIVTGSLPADTYYIKVVSSTRTSSGSYRIKWN